MLSQRTKAEAFNNAMVVVETCVGEAVYNPVESENGYMGVMGVLAVVVVWEAVKVLATIVVRALYHARTNGETEESARCGLVICRDVTTQCDAEGPHDRRARRTRAVMTQSQTTYRQDLRNSHFQVSRPSEEGAWVFRD